MTAEQLRNSILQEAISGRLVPQDPNDEPASALLARIREEKARLVKEGKLKKKDLEETPIAEDEIPFDIPSSWVWGRLRFFCSRFSTGPFGTMVHKEDYVENNGHNLINPTNIKQRKIIADGIKQVSEAKYKELNSYVLAFNDLVLARRGDLSKIAIVSKKEEGWLAGTGAFFMHFYDGIYLPYFIYLYTSPFCQNYLLQQSVGGTMDNLNQKLLADFIFPLPPLAEQKRIVAKLEELLPIVDQYGKAQKELDELNAALPTRLRQSILLEAISGKLIPQDENDEPARVLLARLDAEKKTLVANKILKKTELDAFELEEQPDTIPTGWQFVKLRKICTLLDGEKKNGKYICMDAKFLRGKSQGIYMEQGKFVHKGDNVILVDGENSGEVFVAPIDGYMGSTFKQLWISKEMYIPYVIYLIKSFKETLRNDKKGAAIPHLKKELFFNLPVGIPPLTEQQRIVAKIEELFEQIDKITK